MFFQQASATGVAEDSQIKYTALREKIMNIANQRVSMITPTPMDIDALNHAREADEWGHIWNYGPPGISWEDSQGNHYN